MIIATVKLSDIELDVDTERPNRTEPNYYASREISMEGGFLIPTFVTTSLAMSKGEF